MLNNIKEELAKNKEMKQSIKKFWNKAKKLEESDAFQEARRKYKTTELKTQRTSEVIRKKLGEIMGIVKESLDEVSKSDLGRNIKDVHSFSGTPSTRSDPLNLVVPSSV